MVFNFAQFFNGAVQPANAAMMADLTNRKNRQQAFSFLYLGVNIGVAVGPLIAGILYKNYVKWIFWGDALTTFISIVLIAFLLKESKPKDLEIKVENNDYDDEKGEEGNVFTVILNYVS